MGKLRGFSAKVVIRKLEKIGYKISRIKGSHVRIEHPNKKDYKSITIPNHKELKIGLLSQIIRDVKLSIDKFLKL